MCCVQRDSALASVNAEIMALIMAKHMLERTSGKSFVLYINKKIYCTRPLQGKLLRNMCLNKFMNWLTNQKRRKKWPKKEN